MIDIDTSKIRECGGDLLKLSQDFTELYDGLYNRINNMPLGTQEWIGQSAIDYSRQVVSEKEKIVEFKKSLYMFGLCMNYIADEYDKTIRESVE